MRIIRLGFLWLLGLFIAVIVALFTINAMDEAQTEEVRALLVRPVVALAPEQNLYLALIGNQAPAGQSPVEFGQSQLALYESLLPYALRDPAVSMAPVETGKPPHLTFKGTLEIPSAVRLSIWPGIEDRKKEIDKLLDENRELFERYRSLSGFTAYQETATPSPFTPFGFPPRNLRSLFLANAALRIKSQNPVLQKAAMDDIERDIRMWHLVLVSSRALLPKMLAGLYVQQDTLLVADMIGDKAIKVEGLIPQLDRITNPFDLADWKVSNALPTEYQSFEPVVEQMTGIPIRTLQAIDRYADNDDATPFTPTGTFWEPVARRFFQKNATDNLRAEDIRRSIALADSPIGTLLSARDAYREWKSKQLDLKSFSLVYNPVGKVMLGHILFDADIYVLRMYDLAALQRLTKLGFEIRRQHVQAEQIVSFMRQHSEWSIHPVTGESYRWSTESDTLAMHPVSDRGAEWRFNIPVWTER